MRQLNVVKRFSRQLKKYSNLDNLLCINKIHFKYINDSSYVSEEVRGK